MMHNSCLLVFAVAFMACVLAIPFVTRLAGWAGAIDRPDNYRRVHKNPIPRMGGLGLAFGVALAIAVLVYGDGLGYWPGLPVWVGRLAYIAMAGSIVLAVGTIDDSRGLNPRTKLIGQTLAVLVLYAGGIRIEGVELLGAVIPLGFPVQVPLPGWSLTIDLSSLLLTVAWFLGCMNIWNLIDGMDGLASGVGVLVAGTLMLVAVHNANLGSAVMAAALAGALAGFLLYNWHPACIFLGDSGSLLLGLLFGVIGVQDSHKGSTAVAILFPILAMGLPISDTAMAIFRRWVRDLPLSSADRRHIHHLLMGLGLTPRQAALVLYLFTAGLCGMVLIGVAYRNELLALVLGVSGCSAFLLVLTSRRDELARLLCDYRERRWRRRQERDAARFTWETIQRIELCETPDHIWMALRGTVSCFGDATMEVRCRLDGRDVLHWSAPAAVEHASAEVSTSFRLLKGQALELSIRSLMTRDRGIESDIVLRALQRIALAAAQRLERIGQPPEKQISGFFGIDDTPARINFQPGGDEPMRGPSRSLEVNSLSKSRENPVEWQDHEEVS